jgi:hypothetical protein
MVRAADPVFQECDYAVVDVANNSTTVFTGPCIYYGCVVTTVLSAHALPIIDGSNTIDSLAASSAVGTRSTNAVGIRCATGILVNPDDAATGNVTVYYRPLQNFTP